MYENYCHCPETIQEAIQDLSGAISADSASPLYGYKKSNPSSSIVADKGANYEPEQCLHCVFKIQSADKVWDLTLKDTDTIGDAEEKPRNRTAVFRNHILPKWKHSKYRRNRIWVYMGEKGDAGDTVSLLQDLGLFHYGRMSLGDKIMRISIQPGRSTGYRKPHWIDADLGFLFFTSGC